MSISGMTITCFAACYVIALALALSRVIPRWSLPTIVTLSISSIGLLAHTLYLVAQAREELAQRAISPLSSWHDFCLLAAWVLVAAYIGLTIRRGENALALFMLPLVLGLIAVAAYFQDAAPFPQRTALSVWRLVHGLTLMLGTTAVILGFATGLMYLVQSYRLKHKLPPARGIRLPSLEWLQNFNRESLVVSTCLLAIGLLSGVVLNLISKADDGGGVGWTDPVVLSSGVLFLWLTAMTIFEATYRPAREGSKVAYLTLGSFVFLGLALYFVLFGSHATTAKAVSPTIRRVSVEHRMRNSAGGTTVYSLGRKPQESVPKNAPKPRRGDSRRTQLICVASSGLWLVTTNNPEAYAPSYILPPLRGSKSASLKPLPGDLNSLKHHPSDGGVA